MGSQYRRFVDLCSTALELNEANLTSDKNGADQMYHESLKNGLVQIKTELSEMGLELNPDESTG